MIILFLDLAVVLITLCFILIVVRGEANIMHSKKIVGTIASINGTTFALKSRVRSNGEAITYTIDASNATITKDNTASNVLGVAVGDMVIVKGIVSGISFTAKTIRNRAPHQKVPPSEDTKIF